MIQRKRCFPNKTEYSERELYFVKVIFCMGAILRDFTGAGNGGKLKENRKRKNKVEIFS